MAGHDAQGALNDQVFIASEVIGRYAISTCENKEQKYAKHMELYKKNNGGGQSTA